MYATHFDLPQTARSDTVASLQAHLSDAVDLAGRTKQAYWSMHARSSERRQLFEVLHDDIEACIDFLCGRIATLSGVGERSVRSMAIERSLGRYPLHAHAGEQHDKIIRNALGRMGKRVRADIDQAAALGDADTVDVLSVISRKIDTQLSVAQARLL